MRMIKAFLPACGDYRPVRPIEFDGAQSAHGGLFLVKHTPTGFCSSPRDISVTVMRWSVR